MLSVIKIADAEYPLGQVALGIEDYYLGVGEAPGVWAGRWSAELGLEGVVEAGQLRALVNGVDPRDGTWWLERRPARKVNAFDATFSAPKSASVLWAFASPEVTSIVSRAHVQAVAEALAFLEAKAAVSRQQTDGVRIRVETQGWAVATFVYRTSRAGDPQLHTHCIVPNVVERADGSFASVDGAVLYTWAKAAGSVYQEQLRRILTERLGVAWGLDRNGTREMIGVTPAQLRAFSKRAAPPSAFLASEHVVRLSVDPAEAVRTPPTWTTTEHLALEHRVLERLDWLINRDLRPLDPAVVERAIAGEGRLGVDQATAVRVLCGPGGAIRSLIAPAGFGKTSSVHAAAVAATGSGLAVLGVTATNRAVAELRDVGIAAVTTRHRPRRAAPRPRGRRDHR